MILVAVKVKQTIQGDQGAEAAINFQRQITEWKADPESSYDRNQPIEPQIRAQEQLFVDQAAAGGDDTIFATQEFLKHNEPFIQGLEDEDAERFLVEANVDKQNGVLASWGAEVNNAPKEVNGTTLFPTEEAKKLHEDLQERIDTGLVTADEGKILFRQLIEALAEGGETELIDKVLSYDRPGLGPLDHVVQDAQKNERDRTRAESQLNSSEEKRLESPLAELTQESKDTGTLTPEALDNWSDRYRYDLPQQVRDTLLSTSLATDQRNLRASITADIKTQIRLSRDQGVNNSYQTATSLARNGRFFELAGYYIPNKNGEGQEWVTPADSKKNFVEREEARIAEKYSGEPEGRSRAVVDLARKTSFKSDYLTQMFEIAEANANPADQVMVGEDGNPMVSPRLTEANSLYRDMIANGDGKILALHLDDATEDWLSNIKILMDFGSDEAQAIATANRTKGAADLGFERIPFKELEKEIRNTAESWSSYFFGNPENDNIRSVAQVAQRLVRVYRKTGMGTKQAVALALERINAGFVMVRGNLIPNHTQNNSVPADFPELAEVVIERYFMDHPDEFDGADSSEMLTIYPVDDGRWVIYNSETGNPVHDGKGRYVIYDDLSAIRENARLEQFEDLEADTEESKANEARREELRSDLPPEGLDNQTSFNRLTGAAPGADSIARIGVELIPDSWLRAKEALTNWKPPTVAETQEPPAETNEAKLLKILEDPKASQPAKVQARRGLAEEAQKLLR